MVIPKPHKSQSTPRERLFLRRKRERAKPVARVILGPVKCGQCSLQEYYRTKYPDVECLRIECIWSDNGMERWEKIKANNPDAIAIIITRNVVDAVTSYYNYFHVRPEEMTFMEFLDWPINHHRHGKLPNIIHGYYFKPWIDKWASVNPLILSLEEMIKNPDFKHINKTTSRRIKINGTKRIVYKPTPEERQIVLDRYDKLRTKELSTTS